MMVTGLWAAFFPRLRRAGALTPEALMEMELKESSQEMRQL
jgi:hypothetical protein